MGLDCLGVKFSLKVDNIPRFGGGARHASSKEKNREQYEEYAYWSGAVRGERLEKGDLCFFISSYLSFLGYRIRNLSPDIISLFISMQCMYKQIFLLFRNATRP